MTKYQVVVKTVSYDVLTIEADDESQLMGIIDDTDESQAHQDAWESATPYDGPEDGCSIVKIFT